MHITSETDGPLIVDGYKIFRVENVREYSYENFNSWRVEVTPSPAPAVPAHSYFVIDTTINEAFSHWFFECAIWLPTFRTLSEREPGLRLLLRSPRHFKVLIAEYFGIGENRICYDFDTTASNVCYFPDPITALNDPTISSTYISLLKNFRCIFADLDYTKSRKCVILPRQKRENFAGNERITDTSDIEERLLEYVVHTDSIKKFRDQIQIIATSEKILVSDGAAFHVNGFMAQNSTIVVFGNITDIQAYTYQKMYAINCMISERNTVYKIPYEAVGGTFHASKFEYEHVRSILGDST